MFKSRLKATAGALLALVVVVWAVWQFGPIQPVLAITHLGDPAKLATLAPRGANPRLNKIVYWLNESERRGLSAEAAVTISQFLNWSREPRASLVRASLLRNLKIANGLGLLTAENSARLRQGKAGVITKGPYLDTTVEIDHILPYSLAPEAGNELANLEMLPRQLNRKKSDRVGPRQLAHAEKLFGAGLITKRSLTRVKKQAERGSGDEAE